MSVLLDTNALIWVLDTKKSRSLGKKARRLVESETIYVSSVSITEITMKSMLGKLPIMITQADLEQAGLLELSYTLEHADALSGFQSLAKHDPFDRMLLAQAVSENMMFLTADKILLSLDLANVVDASV